MKFSIFGAMSKEEAREYLDEFLAFGKNRGMKILEENLHFTTDLDFSTESLPAVFNALIPILQTVPRQSDPKVPEFIRNTEDYQKGLFDFDEASNMIVLAAAYYLGEALVRNFPRLKWSTGTTDYLEDNMPVITNFNHNLEMAPILIIENLFRRIVKDSDRLEDTKKAIEMWLIDASN